MANNIRPFGRGRPDKRKAPDAKAKLQGHRGRLQSKTTIVHELFKEFDDAMREERRACGVIDLAEREAEASDDAECDDECLAARIKCKEVRRRLLSAARDLNDV